MSTVDFRKASARAAAKLTKKKTNKAVVNLTGTNPNTQHPVRGTDERGGLRDTAAGRALGMAPTPKLSRPTLGNPTPLVTPPRGKKKTTTANKKGTPKSSVPTPTTTQRSSTASTVSTKNAVATGSSGPGASPSTTSRSPRAAGSGKGGGPATPAPTNTAAAPATDQVGDLFGAANREIERQRQIVEATRLSRLQDQKKFDDWIAAQRGTSDQSLANAFAKSAQDAAAARQQSLDAVNKYANQASLQAAGISGLLDQAGTDANLQSYGFRTNADAQDSAGGAFTQAALSQRQNQQQEGDRARAANMVASYNAQAAKGNQDLNTQSSDLSLKEIQARIDQGNKDRQFQLDSQAAAFLQDLKGGELEVKQANAQTARYAAEQSAQAKRESLAVQKAYNQGRLTIAQKNTKLKAIALRDKQRQAAGGGNAQKLRQDASKFLTSWNKDTLAAQGLPSAPDGDAGIAYARSAISKLRGFAPGLKTGQAYSMLAGILPGAVLQDARITNAIAQSFK